MVIASPDVGGSKRANTYAKYLGCPLVLCNKTRLRANVVDSMQIIGDVVDKNVIIVDDIVDTAGTICNAANALKERGAKRVRACATHGVLSGPAKERIAGSAIEEMLFLNTIPVPEEKMLDKYHFLSVAPVFAEAMRRVHYNESLSSLFVKK